MFWTSSERNLVHGGIETSYMNGRELRWLNTGESHFPRGLAIDHPAKRLYWSDHRTRGVYSMKLDGSDIHTIKIFSNIFDHHFKIAVFEDFLYINMEESGSIYRLHKFSKAVSARLHLLRQYTSVIPHIAVVQENKHKRGGGYCFSSIVQTKILLTYERILRYNYCPYSKVG